LYHSYEKKLPPGVTEQSLLAETVRDEFYFEDATVRNEGEEPPADQPVTAPQRLYPDDDEEFQPEPEWDDLDLSDDEVLDDEEDDLEEQAEKARVYLTQMVAMCPICRGEIVDKHMASCGHNCCLACWRQMGCNLVNTNKNTPDDPLPKCPKCRAGIKFLIRNTEEHFVPRSQLVDDLTSFVAEVRHQPQPQFVNPWSKIFFHTQKALFYNLVIQHRITSGVIYNVLFTFRFLHLLQHEETYNFYLLYSTSGSNCHNCSSNCHLCSSQTTNWHTDCDPYQRSR